MPRCNTNALTLSPAKRLFLCAYFGALAAGSCLLLALFHRNGAWMFLSNGSPRITDFAVFWAAAQRILWGQPTLIYDAARHVSLQGQLLGQEPVPALAYPYPPTSLLFVWPLGLFPYIVAWTAFVVAGLTVWCATLQRIAGNWLLAALMAMSAGGATYSLLLGQNGFFTAALLCGGLVLLPTRKVAAGVLFGMLSFKPHLAAPVIVALAVWKEWRALAGAGISVLALISISTAAFGPDIWPAFLAGASKHAETHAALAIGTLKGQSVADMFAPAVGVQSALAFQIASALVSNVISWKRPPGDTRAAAIICSTLLSTPYSYLYDLTALTGAGAFLLRSRASWADIAVVATALLLPPIWFLIWAPVGPLVALMLLGLACMQGRAMPLLRERPASGERLGADDREDPHEQARNHINQIMDPADRRR